VTHAGGDHTLPQVQPGAEPPPRAEEITAAPFLLCLGADFRHKNRLFAIRLLEQLRGGHGFEGALVLAGPHAARGSSAGEEAAYLTTRPQLARHVIELPPVSEGAKLWLLQRAAAVLFPSVYEGFGFVPFEAAEAGVPCVFASQSSLAEVLPEEAATLVPWDVAESAEHIAEVLRDPGPLLEAVRGAAARFTWDACARGTLEVYSEAVRGPTREARAVAEDAVGLDLEYASLREAAGPDGLALVGPGGALPMRDRRPLLALATRPRLRDPLFAVIRLLYRLAHRRDA
jgi:Glycosyl transferases group 1